MVRNVAARGRELAIEWSDGHRTEFHALRLRDNCLCGQCAHPGTGQRLLDTAAIPAAVRLRRYDDTGKVAGAPTPDLEHYRPFLEAALT